MGDYFKSSFKLYKCDENNFTKSRRARRGIAEHSVGAPRAIIDPVTEQDIIGGVGWHILEMVEQISAGFIGALLGIGEVDLHMVKPITLGNSKDGKILVGHAYAAYDNRNEQSETMLNSHDLQKHGVVVNDTTKRDGGEQNLILDDITIQLDFVDEKTVSFYLQCASSDDLRNMSIHWIWPEKDKTRYSESSRGSPVRLKRRSSTWEGK